MSKIPNAFVSVHEFDRVSDRVARVTASINEMRPLTTDERFDAIAENLPRGTTPVRASFHAVGNNTYTGFVFSAPEIRLLNDDDTMKKVSAGAYREIAKNIFMDSTDNTLWDVKEGAGGKFLVRQGQDDLSAMLETARTSPSGTTIRLAAIASVNPRQNEFVAYVRSGRLQHEVDYGTVLSKKRGSSFVLSMATKTIVEVPDSVVVTSVTLDPESIPRLPEKAMNRIRASRGVTAANAQVQMTPEEYWRNVYSYAPEYLEKVLEQVREMSAA